MSPRWESIALFKIKKWKPKASLGCTETRFNMVVVKLRKHQASYSDGNLLLTIWMLKKEKQTDYSSKTKTTKRDATKYSNKVPKERR